MKYEIEIPEGYEFDRTFDVIDLDGMPRIEIKLKQKQTKDFDYFVDQYLSESNSTVDFITGWIPDRDIEVAKKRLKTKQFDLVCWEIKIGIIKFICDDLGGTWHCFSHWIPYNYNDLSNTAPMSHKAQDTNKAILNIIPEELIKEMWDLKTKTN